MANTNVDKVATLEWNEILNPKRKRLIVADKKKTDESSN
jgi:hypothetical protein